MSTNAATRLCPTDEETVKESILSGLTPNIIISYSQILHDSVPQTLSRILRNGPRPTDVLLGCDLTSVPATKPRNTNPSLKHMKRQYSKSRRLSSSLVSQLQQSSCSVEGPRIRS